MLELSSLGHGPKGMSGELSSYGVLPSCIVHMKIVPVTIVTGHCNNTKYLNHWNTVSVYKFV